MAAAAFSDDAYNKRLQGGSGTLIGNWAEERELRDASGEGRSIPQRHIPRSGLLKDWTKVPAGGARKQDNTFERIYGPKAQHAHVPQSRSIGAGEEDLTGEQPVPERLQAEGRVTRVGPKEVLQRQARHAIAEQEVLAEEYEVAREANMRQFDTTSGVVFSKPDESLSEKPTYLRKAYKEELLHGPPADRLRGLGNEGLDVPTHAHYSNVEPVTHCRMSLADPLSRNDMKVSAGGGVSAFGRHSEFSKPIGEFMTGLAKDEEMELIFNGLKGTQPLRNLGGAEPRAAAFASVPSLATLKSKIHGLIAEAWGPHGYVVLRQRLFDCSDHEGFVQKKDISGVLRDELGLSTTEVPEDMLDVYLAQLITMKKTELRVGAFISSLRPSLPQKDKRRVLQAFRALNPVDGQVSLNTWLNQLQDPILRKTVASAFGTEEEELGGADVPVSETVFLELFSDLAPLSDIDGILGATGA